MWRCCVVRTSRFYSNRSISSVIAASLDPRSRPQNFHHAGIDRLNERCASMDDQLHPQMPRSFSTKHRPLPDLKSVQEHLQKRLRNVGHDSGALLYDTDRFFLALQQVFPQTPSKHHDKILNALHTIMDVYRGVAENIHEHEGKLFQKSLNVLEWMGENRLSVWHHWDKALAIAVKEGNEWEKAAQLVWKNIASDEHPPSMNSPEALSHCLLAVAQSNNNHPALAVEHTLEVTRQLSVANPTDQAEFIRAAGEAIGSVDGAWEIYVEYWKRSLAKQHSDYPNPGLVHALAASVMKSCQIAGEFEAALEVFDTVYGGTKRQPTEWQWGGGSDQLDEHCVNVALQCLENDLSRALDLLNETDIDVSDDSLVAVMAACEREAAWSSAIKIWERQIEHERHQLLPRLLPSVMRTCNASMNFGISIYCLEQLNQALSVKSGGEADESLNMMEQSLAGNIKILADFSGDEIIVDQVLTSTMTALCGLGCRDLAATLFESMSSSLGDDANLFHSGRVFDWATSSDATFRRRSEHIIGWESAYRHIRMLMQAKKTNEMSILLAVLPVAMRSCAEADQTDLALKLQQEYLGSVSDPSSIPDAALAEILRLSSDSISLFDAAVQSHSSEEDFVRSYPLSCQEGLRVLLDSDLGTGVDLYTRLYQNIDPLPDTMLLVAKSFAANKEWDDVVKIYRAAVENGGLSEELGLLAMEAVAMMKVTQEDGRQSNNRKLRMLRALVENTSKCAAGVHDPIRWTETRYWKLKQRMGFRFVRLLMWWNDISTCHLDELQFALEEFKKFESNPKLRPPFEVLRTIAVNAGELTLAPPTRGGLALVPRRAEDWQKLLPRVLQAFEGLGSNVFVLNVVQAYARVGKPEESVLFAHSVLRKGYSVPFDTLRRVMQIMDSIKDESMRASLEPAMLDIRMNLGPKLDNVHSGERRASAK